MGAGGAFGPMKYGQPSTSMESPAVYNNNPGSFAAFNNQPLSNIANANTAASIGNQQRQLQGQATAAGEGRSAGNNAAQRDIAAQGQNTIANTNLQGAQNSFNQQLEQQNASNQFAQQAQALGQAAYGQQAALYNQQIANRQAAIGNLPGGGLINVFGGGGGY